MSNNNRRRSRNSRSRSPRSQHSTSPQQRDNSTIDPQQNDNDGPDSEIKKGKSPGRWFCKPLIPNGWKHTSDVSKGTEPSQQRSKVRFVGGVLIVSHSILLIVYGILGLTCGHKTSKVDALVYAGSIAPAFAYLVQYADDIDACFLSIYEIGNKNYIKYLAEPILEKLPPIGFQIFRLFYQFLNGRHGFWTFLVGILGFSFYILGNLLLILEKKKNPKPMTNDLIVNGSA